MLRESFERIQKKQADSKGREVVQEIVRKWTVDDVKRMFFNKSSARELGEHFFDIIRKDSSSMIEC